METVLAADMTTPFGAQSTWRQLVDLIGRGRVEPSAAAMARLKALRPTVPPPVRAASARALASARPPAALVRLFATDDISIAAPVLRGARLTGAAWVEMLPGMSPATRSILRHRRDLPPQVTRALESFGSVDFVLAAAEATVGSETALSDAGMPGGPPVSAETVAGSDASADSVTAESENTSLAAEPDPLPGAHTDTAVEPNAASVPTLAPVDSTFVSLSSVALGLPVVAEALRQGAEPDPAVEATARVSEDPVPATSPSPSPEAAPGTFQIAELVARIDAYQRRREGTPAFAFPATGPETQPELFVLDHAPAQDFRFETDATGIVRWIEGAARAPLIGLSLDLNALPGAASVDGVAAGAFRRRAGFANARLVVEGNSDAAGQWRINGIPVFDRASGRFTGYRGTARRPRADEMAEPAREGRNVASDALRQLVHELRTPANAISGFAEMIESQMLGPVPGPYRAHAAAIRGQASNLLGAIDDIDMAARIESDALDLHPGDVPVAPMLARIADDLAPLARLRGAEIMVEAGSQGMAIAGDDRAVERLIARLFATLVSSAARGERIGVVAAGEGDRTVALVIDRPKALGAYPEERLLTIDAEAEADREGAPLLGTGFALRLARNLAAELGGSLSIGDNALTLRLPAAFLPDVEQVS